MKPISRLRFSALAGYSRSPSSALIISELAWYEEGNERILGLVALDLPDQDYASYVLGRDARGRFRAVWLECSIESQEKAIEILREKMVEFCKMPDGEFHQGDERGGPVDVFTPIVPVERQHRNFSALNAQPGYSPSRELIGEMMHYFEDLDGNFVQQFQSSAFDARLWELYLYALLNELGYGLNHEHAAPDFHCQGILGNFFVEATTVNPTDGAANFTISNREEYFEHYVPLKYGSSLYSKLVKKYWEQPHVAGSPLVLAVQDFHAPDAMIWSNSALVEYLFAVRQVERVGSDGQIEIVSEPVEEYRRQAKSPIPAGFFSLPLSENISAVLANPSGTISKFNRMAFLAGFGNREIQMYRSGYCYANSLTPERFYSEVHSPDYTETWCEGLSVYHNPAAKIPLPPESLPCAAHHTVRGGRIVSHVPPFHPLGSVTAIIVPQQ